MDHFLEEIFYVEGQIQQATLNNDVQALEQLLHDDLLFIGWSGGVVVKQDIITNQTLAAIILTELDFIESPVIRIYGDTAISFSKEQVKGIFRGTPFASFSRYLRVWHFQEERWQIVAGNVSVIAEICIRNKGER